ncbi:MAG: PEGA domain-containing protein [Sandaracinaceae bacterium]
MLVWLLSALSFTTPLCAQEAEPPDEERAEPDAEASDVVVEPVDEDPALTEARQRFEQGMALVRAGNCAGAIAELNRSFELVPRPNTALNIARCQEELHRYDLAIAGYQRYLELADPDDPDRASVVQTMRMLGTLLGTIEVASNVEAEVWLDDRVVGAAPGATLVPGGRHAIELRAEGYLPERREVEVAAGRTASIDIALRSAEENLTIEPRTTVERPPLPAPVFWGGVALTLITAAVGTYFGVSALELHDREVNRDLRLPPDVSGIQESALFADVFFITAGVLGAATVVVAFLTDWGGEPEDGEPAPPETARLGVGPSGVVVQGTFR